LSGAYVGRLSLRNLQLCGQLVGSGNNGHGGPRLHPLADLKVETLDDAIRASLNAQ
jgi:hypothetical protein